MLIIDSHFRFGSGNDEKKMNLRQTIDNAVDRIMPSTSSNTPRTPSRIVFDMPTTETPLPRGQLTAAENGAISLYREYAAHYERQQGAELEDEPKKEKKKKRIDFEVDNELLNLGLKQLRPMFDCEISRRPHLTLAKPTEKPTVVLTLSIVCLNGFQTRDNKGAKNKVQYDHMDVAFPILVSWLMTLVEHSTDTPFVVVGMHMMTKNNVPYVYVMINPNEDEATAETDAKKIKKRKNYSEFNEFVAKIKRYMLNTKLTDVTQWAWKTGSPIDQLLSEMEFAQCSDKTLATFFQINVDENAADNLKKEQYGFEWAQIIPQNVMHQQQRSVTSNMLNFENCFGLVLGDAFPIGYAVLEMLIKVNMHCMDVCGLRLCWLTKEEYNTATISATFSRGTL